MSDRPFPGGPVATLVLSALVGLCLLAVFAVVGHGAGGAGEGTGVPSTLIDELSDGGEILLLRHALTDQSASDADPTARGGCDQQRNLSPEGVEQAAEIGARLAALRIPLGEVYASPFCRTVDTAQALAGRATETDALVSLTSALDQAGQAAITLEATALIDESLGGEALTVMVTHTQNIEALAGVTVEEGGGVVLGRGDGQVEVLGVVAAEDW